MKMMQVEEIESLPRQGLESIQLKRLQKLVARVYDRVKPYREKMDAVGVRPEDIQSLADLRKLPFTTKDDLRDNYPFGLFTVPMEEIVRGGGGEARVTQRLRNALEQEGWRKKSFQIETRIKDWLVELDNNKKV